MDDLLGAQLVAEGMNLLQEDTSSMGPKQLENWNNRAERIIEKIRVLEFLESRTAPERSNQ